MEAEYASHLFLHQSPMSVTRGDMKMKSCTFHHKADDLKIKTKMVAT